MTTEMDGVHEYPVSAGRQPTAPSVLRARARIGAHTRWAHEDDRVAATQPMRDARERKFEDQVDPDHTLRVADPEGFAKRVANAKSAYYTALGLKSGKARAARKKSA